MKQTKKNRHGKHAVEYKLDDAGNYWRKNHAGNWVKLNPVYAQHRQAYRAAVAALGK